MSIEDIIKEIKNRYDEKKDEDTEFVVVKAEKNDNGEWSFNIDNAIQDQDKRDKVDELLKKMFGDKIKINKNQEKIDELKNKLNEKKESFNQIEKLYELAKIVYEEYEKNVLNEIKELEE